MKEFEPICEELLALIKIWEPKLKTLSPEIIVERRNTQNRTIKQIVGHMVDSASNNTHRIVHLQYGENPLIFPNYATFGNNDRWIAIQDYQNEDWLNLIHLWTYSNLHIVHVIRNVKVEKLGNEWISGPEQKTTLRAMIVDFLRHFKLHLAEIDALIGKK